jgi:isochorismate synthase
MPKWESMDFIVANEPYERSWYTGFWGPVNLANKEGVQFYVNLRCLHWSGKRLSLFAGGGITLGSELDKEWEETEVKMNTLRDVLAL